MPIKNSLLLQTLDILRHQPIYPITIHLSRIEKCDQSRDV